MRRRRRALQRLLLLCCLAACPAPTEGGGGAKLWQLGPLVEENPIIVFSMFAFTVFLTVAIELLKHAIEHRTHDPHRQQGLTVIYAELMMVGVVSFLLIVSAELGLTDLRITWFDDCDTPSAQSGSQASAAGSAAAAAASGSGSSACGIGFDLLLFEYAHLVIFFMGLTYGAFIFIGFWQRDRLCQEIASIQNERTLMGWYDMSSKAHPDSLFGPIGFSKKGWARTVLTLRAIIAIHHRKELRAVSSTAEHLYEKALYHVRGDPPPLQMDRISDEDVPHFFDMAKFTKCAFSETMLDLLHVPPVVWLAIVAAAGGNLIHKFGPALSEAVAYMAILGPLLASVLLWRLSAMLHGVVRHGVGHPEIPNQEFHNAKGRRQDHLDPPFEPIPMDHGKKWAEEPDEHPWSILEGCIPDDHALGFLDPLDPVAIERQIQVVIFASCFYVGQLIMLSFHIWDERGPLLIVLWLFPIFPLISLIPRAILVYAITHLSCSPPRNWLRASMQTHEADHSHGHGHGHGHGHHMYDDPALELKHWKHEKEKHDRELLDELSDKYPCALAIAVREAERRWAAGEPIKPRRQPSLHGHGRGNGSGMHHPLASTRAPIEPPHRARRHPAEFSPTRDSTAEWEELDYGDPRNSPGDLPFQSVASRGSHLSIRGGDLRSRVMAAREIVQARRPGMRSTVGYPRR
eukprot:TRINITY_DN3961_c0_g2_i1.p1 TRINITY_DN3961_c0_g2~~TRINITY_DN3961_c0_g2_i1.p1  ORF type:complete len:713 (+),score=213.93 TRINITY_DN3961_c0_g2_i1:79-2139(+)